MLENKSANELSQRKYALLFNYSIACIAFHKIIYDPNNTPVNYKYTDVNPMFEKVLSLQRESVIGKPVTELFGIDKPPFFDIFLNVAETLTPISFSSKFDVLNKYFKISAFSYKKGTFVVVFEDITSYMETIQKLNEKEEELNRFNLQLEADIALKTNKTRESESKFKNIIESSPMGIHMYKLEPDGRLVFLGANSSANKILGVNHSIFIGKTIEEAFPPLIETEVPDQYRKVAKDGGVWSVNQINYHYEQIRGAYEVHAFQTSPGEMAVFFSDIAERLRDKKELVESEEKYRALFEQAADAITITDPTTGNIIDFNTKAYENLGYSREEFEKMRISDFNMSESEESVMKHIDKIIREGSDLFEVQFMTKLGKIRDTLINAEKVKIQDKYYIQAISRDITDLKRAELKFHQAYNLAEFYKDLFAHDISNIMQNILTSTELCSIYLKKMENPEKIDNLFDLIKAQVKRGAELISNVRKLSSLQENNLHYKVIEINALLNELVSKLEGDYLEIKINFQIESKKESIRVKTSPLLSDAFENILKNAIIHNDNSKIEIFVKITELEKENSKFIKLEFIDNGKGVIDSQKSEIFQRQISDDQKSKGIGLGLLLVNRIIESIKGEIWVEDKIKGDHAKGSNFVIIIPDLS